MAAGFIAVPAAAFLSAVFGGIAPLFALRNLLSLIMFTLLPAGGC